MSENFTGNLPNFTDEIFENYESNKNFTRIGKINSTINATNFTDIAYGNFKNDKNSTYENFKNSTSKIKVKISSYHIHM